jgi:repressor LexA
MAVGNTMNEPQTTLDLNNLPPRQRDVISFILSLTEQHGYPPTLAELAKAMGLKNRMTVHQHVQALKKKGFVHWEPGLNRSLRVLYHVQLQNDSQVGGPTAFRGQPGGSKAGLSSPGIPFVGRIAAGGPIDAVGADEYLEIDRQYTSDPGCFALKVKGDSMIEDGIFDGDFVIIKPNPSPRNGEVVVALLEDGSATLKRFYKEKGRFRLEPANKNYQPIEVSGDHKLEIQGVVVALFRKM